MSRATRCGLSRLSCDLRSNQHTHDMEANTALARPDGTLFCLKFVAQTLGLGAGTCATS